MSFADQIERDLIAALKSGDRTRLATLRLLKAAAKNAEVAKRSALTDEEYQDVVRRQVKMRREAATEFDRGGRPDRADVERAEEAILRGYLPQQLDEDAVRVAVVRAIHDTGAKGPHDLGRVMSHAMRELKGRAEGSQVNAVAQSLLAPRDR